MAACQAALAGIGVLMAGARSCFIQAIRRADTSFVSPFWYATLVFAALYDMAIFGVVPAASRCWARRSSWRARAFWPGARPC
ncbi:conserved hypothetical protein [Citreicella sp. SE45]|nr:conserved hypothetical protein [Citreicella sp. SE45]